MEFKTNFTLYFLSIFLVLFAIILGSSVFIYKINKDHAVDLLIKDVNNNNTRVQTLLSNSFEDVVKDLNILANSNEIKDFINTNSEKSLKRLNDQFELYSKIKPIYFQIRFIDTNGYEKARINNINNDVEIVSNKDLQDKAKRYYFKKSINLKRNEIYISPIDLNIENSKIEIPYKPTIRFATPVFTKKNTKAGILIVNFNAKNLLEKVTKITMDTSLVKMLVNSEGYFLKSKNPNEEWGFMLPNGKTKNFSKNYEDVWNKIKNTDEGRLNSKNGIFIFSTVRPLKESWFTSFDNEDDNNSNNTVQLAENYFWKIITLIPQNKIDYFLGKREINSFFTPIIFTLLSLLIAFFGSSLILKRKVAEENRNKVLREITESEEKFRNLLDYTVSWEYWILSNKNVQYCSKSSEMITGYSSKEFIENKELLNELILDEHKTIYENHIKNQFRDAEIHNLDLKIKTKNGEVKYIQHKCQPIYDELGNFIGRRVSNSDISILKQKQHVIEEQQKLLMEELESKNKFLSIISHDIKSPILDIKTLSQMIVDDYQDFSEEELKDSLESMNIGLGNISALINNLLSWARLQNNQISYQPDNYDLNKIVDEVIKLYSLKISEKKIILENKINPEHTVYTDRQIIETVFRNLISNALKFTPEGGKITIDSIEVSGYEEIAVTDTGVGIPEDRINKLFKVGEHSTTLGTNKEKGNGVGLILCKELVIQNGGNIRVESKQNIGSSFIFSIPKSKNS